MLFRSRDKALGLLHIRAETACAVCWNHRPFHSEYVCCGLADAVRHALWPPNEVRHLSLRKADKHFTQHRFHFSVGSPSSGSLQQANQRLARPSWLAPDAVCMSLPFVLFFAARLFRNIVSNEYLQFLGKNPKTGDEKFKKNEKFVKSKGREDFGKY